MTYVIKVKNIYYKNFLESSASIKLSRSVR